MISQICDALRDLVPFVQFKVRVKHTQSSACNFTTTLLKVILLYDYFSNVLSCTNDTKSLMVSQIQFSKQSSFSFVHLCIILCGMRLLHIIYYFWTNTFYWMVQVTGIAPHNLDSFHSIHTWLFFSQRK